MFNFIKKYYNIILIAGLTIALIISITQCSNTKQSLKLSDYNVKALTDTLTVTKNKLGEEQKSKLTLITDIKGLKDLNSSLSTEVDKLTKKEQKNLVEINKLSVKINMLKDSIQKINGFTTQINDTVYRADFDNTDKITSAGKEITLRELAGFSLLNISSKTSKTFLTKDMVYADITIGKEITKDGIKIFASSSNPYVSIGSIDGALIKPEAYQKYIKPDNRNWNISISVGYGAAYNVTNSNITLSPFFGVTIGRTLIKF